VLIGRVVDLDEFEGEYGRYVVVVVERDGGERVAWHAKPVVAKSELAKAAPDVGDRIGIRYDGSQGERNYHAFRVVLGRPPRIDWSRYRQGRKER
jgi:hypothetical protein